jgi:alkaline phosphatase
MYHRRSRAVLAIAIALFLFVSLSPCLAAEEGGKHFRNVILMVPDGCSISQITVARWYKGTPLALDRMALGAVRTYGSDALITDSAPAATAFATGHKTFYGAISVLPGPVTIPGVAPITRQQQYKPVATILEGAKLAGKSVGLVATSNIQHATPAAFSAHWPDRSDYHQTGKQQVYQGMNVVLGGGKKYLLPEEKGGSRTDGKDLIATLRASGYLFVETSEEMKRAGGSKVWGAFADDSMAYDFERARFRPAEPTLSEMTEKAIRLLSSANQKGFFLFVEGSKVDWVAHANDPVGVIGEVLAFDEAVRVVLDYAEKDGQTLVLVFTDHGTGGMSLGSGSPVKSASRAPVQEFFGPLKRATLTADGVAQELGRGFSEETLKATVAKFYGISDLTAEETKTLAGAGKKLNQALGPMMSKRSHIGWTTRGHTGEDVFLFYYGHDKALGLLENTEIARIAARTLGVDLDETDNRLFVPAEGLFQGQDISLSVEGKGEAATLVARKGEIRAEFPLGTNLMRVYPSGKTYELEGISILAPKTGKAYLPRQAAALFKDLPATRPGAR